jgi:hypothetical protein
MAMKKTGGSVMVSGRFPWTPSTVAMTETEPAAVAVTRPVWLTVARDELLVEYEMVRPVSWLLEASK